MKHITILIINIFNFLFNLYFYCRLKQNDEKNKEKPLTDEEYKKAFEECIDCKNIHLIELQNGDKIWTCQRANENKPCKYEKTKGE